MKINRLALAPFAAELEKAAHMLLEIVVQGRPHARELIVRSRILRSADLEIVELVKRSRVDLEERGEQRLAKRARIARIELAIAELRMQAHALFEKTIDPDLADRKPRAQRGQLEVDPRLAVERGLFLVHLNALHPMLERKAGLVAQ